MKSSGVLIFAFCGACAFAGLEVAADSGWKFVLGDPAGAEGRSFADASWRTVNLPHDWSIEGVPDRSNPTGAGGGFFPAGTGWYRKTFHAPSQWKGKRVTVEFDGVYRNATVYLNGHKLGNQPYGYTSFFFDLSGDLDFSEAPNVLAVRVDNSAQPNSRWYSGSGIYRHVRVVVTDPVHVAHWGVFVTTAEASSGSAKISVRTRVSNETGSEGGFTVQTSLINQAGRTVGIAQSAIQAAARSETEASQLIAVTRPALWSPASPVLYRAVTRVMRGGKVLDEVVTRFGIRTLKWSAEQGLVLNGKSIKLTGGSVHHDNGPLGAAAFDRAEERRVELLKGAGHNAVRTAHNIPSPAFLDACDRVGLLVLDEPFDTWHVSKVKFDYSHDFDEWWQRDVSAMVLRDRNHPSVVIWGIGNEIPEAYIEKGGLIAKQLASQIRSLDSSRPVTQAFPGTTSGAAHEAVYQSLDMVGYNYNLAANYAQDHRQAPSRIMLTTESYGGDAYEQWRLSQDNPFVIGEFVWTAMDYLGESGIGAWKYGTREQAAQAAQWGKMSELMTWLTDAHFIGMLKTAGEKPPQQQQAAPPKMEGSMMSILAFLFAGYPWHAAECGDIDLTGHRRPQSYYRDILWNGGDRVYTTVRPPEPEGKKIIAIGWTVYPTIPSWTWPEQEGKEVQVEVYSGAERVRLFLNGKLIGEKPTGREQEFKAAFVVPYAAGTLQAVGMRGDRQVAESVLTTAGAAVRVRLTADRTSLSADGQDLSFVTVETVDSEGRFQPNANQEVQFSISGPGTIAAVGNGDGKDGASYQGDKCKLFEGRAVVVVRTSSMKRGGSIRLTATIPGLAGSGVVTIQAKPAVGQAVLE